MRYLGSAILIAACLALAASPVCAQGIVTGNIVGRVTDPTGAAVAGRYTVRFSSDWNQSISLGRSDVEIELIEVA